MSEPIDLDELERLATAARNFGALNHPDWIGLCPASGNECQAFRTALSPDLILALIAENRRLREALKEETVAFARYVAAFPEHAPAATE